MNYPIWDVPASGLPIVHPAATSMLLNTFVWGGGRQSLKRQPGA